MKRFFNLSRTNDRRKGDQEIKLQHRAGSVEEPGGWDWRKGLWGDRPNGFRKAVERSRRREAARALCIQAASTPARAGFLPFRLQGPEYMRGIASRCINSSDWAARKTGGTRGEPHALDRRGAGALPYQMAGRNSEFCGLLETAEHRLRRQTAKGRRKSHASWLTCRGHDQIRIVSAEHARSRCQCFFGARLAGSLQARIGIESGEIGCLYRPQIVPLSRRRFGTSCSAGKPR